MKRFSAFLLAVILLLCNTTVVQACDENQSNTYITQILFGDDASSHDSDEDVKMLLDAIYICCEQADNLGQDKLDYLKKQKVNQVPSLANINIKSDSLLECSHNYWEYEYAANKKVQEKRKKILLNTVNEVFDFGTISNLFGSKSGKCNSFSAFLYYSHLLSDYLADDPENTSTVVNGREINSYCGQAYIDLNGGNPSFSTQQKEQTNSVVNITSQDVYGRSGIAFACIGEDLLPSANSRQNIGMIKPSGWNQQSYLGLVNSTPPYLYNRCHLIAHQLIGNDNKENLITGTRYLNETGMKPFEDMVAQYIQKTKNHVLYRATPVYEGDNMVASGVQLEAYSVEDHGEGICFNVYCYNVQPGVVINYATGASEKSDNVFDNENVLPFAVFNASENNPDLIFEINKHLEILFADQKKKNNIVYNQLMGDIYTIAYEARSLQNSNASSAQYYISLKDCEYRLLDTLNTYIPMLLEKEEFFKSAFN